MLILSRDTASGRLETPCASLSASLAPKTSNDHNSAQNCPRKMHSSAPITSAPPQKESPPPYENAEKEWKTEKPETTETHGPSDFEKIQKLTMENRQLEAQVERTKLTIAIANRDHQKQQEGYEKKLKEQRDEIRKLSELHEEDKRRVCYAEKNIDEISKNFNKTKEELAESYDKNRKLFDKLKEYERYAYAQSDCDYCNNLEVNHADKVFYDEQLEDDSEEEDARIEEIAQIQETQRREIEDLKKKHQEDIGEIFKRLELVEKWREEKDVEDSGYFLIDSEESL
ncbi:Protein CBG26822 [Caenorhabditis briggsae]|uniref:Protein CBG26822 n=1 Tax=Caenorhabditis briggsae TaxID=6238 RepID=B6IJU1_CAEBR|nr:Protein CBG26822 [Caenorhabditis briggsae]CAS00171.1 Protein CBG26822 [Caenorhabditis briggsae]